MVCILPVSDRSKRLTPKYLSSNKRTSGISIPHFFANKAYSYSTLPIFCGSLVDLNFTNHSLSSILTKTLGLAPPGDPPNLYNVSIPPPEYSVANIFSASSARISKLATSFGL